MRFNYFLKAVCKTNSPSVLLTFDDGPNPSTTPQILDALDENGVKAMFFVVGKKAEQFPEIVERIKKEGHGIGNHTFTHPPLFALLNGKKVTTEINELMQFLDRKSIQTSLFRPPIGYTNPIIARVVEQVGLTVVGWNRRSYDTVIKNSKLLSKRLLKQATPGSILLLHDNLPQTAKAIPSFLKSAKEKGIIFASEQEIESFGNENV